MMKLFPKRLVPPGESLGWLRALKKKIPLEIEYPVRNYFSLRRLDRKQTRFLKLDRKDSSTTRLLVDSGTRKAKVAVRLRAPANISEPLPVLFLFHGAGGSENMFFETYGAGRAVHDGIQRGWLVVAPRLGFAGPGLECGAILDELSKCFTIDRKRVMMIGHSMGAGQVVRQATLDPTLPAALAALGGGARPGKLPEVAKLLGSSVPENWTSASDLPPPFGMLWLRTKPIKWNFANILAWNTW